MKCINVTFNTIDDLEFAMSNLKNNFDFSYSLINNKEHDFETQYDKDTFISPNFYNFSSLTSPYILGAAFAPYPPAGVTNTQNFTQSDISDIVVRIKCRDNVSNELKNRLINLNGRHIKII